MNFLKKLFGKGDSKGSSTETLINDTLSGVIEKAGLDLSWEVKADGEDIRVELFGEDENLLREKDGMLLDAFQFFVKRVVQHNFPESRIEVSFDNNGYREQANEALIEMAEKLKEAALEKGKSMYVKALPPKERKVIHQYLASDERIRSRSIGDGHFKRIKIYPAKSAGRSQESSDDLAESADS